MDYVDFSDFFENDSEAEEISSENNNGQNSSLQIPTVKKYSDFLQEITADELYEKLIKYGLFSSKLPDIFDVSMFFDEYKNVDKDSYNKKPFGYIQYASMRNINIPRPIGIPTPMGYDRLCKCLKENWENIKTFFESATKNHAYTISRIHIRKMPNNNAIFNMNFKNWKEDGSPESELAIGKRFLVCADVSKCFPSIYTHALSWALAGKQTAKQNKLNRKIWYNQIDHYVQYSKNGETHGILIGPHASNILSEVILCKVDEKLSNNWEYIRHIDDFKCYVKTREEADRFLIELNNALREYGLSINHEKTKILELPVADVEHWSVQIRDREIYFRNTGRRVDYKDISSFFNFCISLMSNNKDNASIIFYSLRMIKKYELTPNAKKYLTQKIISLSLIYPYIVPMLGKLIFSRYNTSEKDCENYVNLIYDTYIEKKLF